MTSFKTNIFVLESSEFEKEIFDIISRDQENKETTELSSKALQNEDKAKIQKATDGKKSGAKTSKPTKTKQPTTPVDANPFEILGAYPDPSAYVPKPKYNKTSFGIINDDNYCKKVDLSNLENPENMFREKGIFFTDYKPGGVVRGAILKFGTIPKSMAHISKALSNEDAAKVLGII